MSDFGSISLIEDVNGIMSFEGLSADDSKLADIANYYKDTIRTGSSCFFYDIKKVKMYEKTTNTWIQIN